MNIVGLKKVFVFYGTIIQLINQVINQVFQHRPIYRLLLFRPIHPNGATPTTFKSH